MNSEAFSSLIEIMVVLFLLLATGFIARRTGVITDIASKNLSKLIVCIGQPMMIVNSLMKIEYSPHNTRVGFSILAICIGVHFFLALFAFFAVKPVKKLDERKIAEFSLVFSNVGFIGFPIYRSIFGEIGEFWGSFYVVGFNLFVWTWGMLILSRGRSDIRLNVRKILINYGTVPCTIGILLYFATKFVEIPDFVITYTGYLNNLCTPISVLIVGALIATRTPKQIFGDGRMYYFSLCRLILMPLCVCIIAKLVGLPDYMVLFATAAAALPSATNVTMFAELYDIVPGYAAQAVGVTSLFTVVTLPFVMLAADYIVKFNF